MDERSQAFGRPPDQMDVSTAQALLYAVLHGRVHAMVGFVVYTDGTGEQIRIGNAPHPLDNL